MLPVNYGMKIINLQLNKNFVLHETALEMKVQSVIYTKDYLNIFGIRERLSLNVTEQSRRLTDCNCIVPMTESGRSSKMDYPIQHSQSNFVFKRTPIYVFVFISMIF